MKNDSRLNKKWTLKVYGPRMTILWTIYVSVYDWHVFIYDSYYDQNYFIENYKLAIDWNIYGPEYGKPGTINRKLG